MIKKYVCIHVYDITIFRIKTRITFFSPREKN